MFITKFFMKKPMEVTIKTQEELNKIKSDFVGTIYIEGGRRFDPLILKTNFEEARVIVKGDAYVEAWESSHVVARGSSHVVARGSSHVVARGSSHVEAWESSHVEAWGSSHVEAWESSHVEAWGSSHVVARGSSHVVARGSSHVDAWGSSHVEVLVSSHVESRGSAHVVARESSHVVAWGSSIHKLFGEATVAAFSAKEIVASGYNVIVVTKSNRKNITIVVNKNSTLKIVPDFKPTFKDYTERYPVEVKGKTAIMYKTVHKKDGRYIADYMAFEYKIGEVHTNNVAPKEHGSCAEGLHISHKSWAIAFGASWSDCALLECEVPIENIVVAADCDGKVRTSELKVLREVPRDEWYV